MNDLEKYLDRVLGPKSADPGPSKTPTRMPMRTIPPEPEPDAEPALNIAGVVRRRWYIVLLTFVVVCSIGIPAVWLMIKRSYVVTGTIKVDPVISNILTGQADRGEISNYTSFMHTQARRVTSMPAVQEVANDLQNKGLHFFEERANTLWERIRRGFKRNTNPDTATVLKQAILDEIITAVPPRRGEEIIVSMTWPNPTESMRIVDSFIQNYMRVEVTSAAEQDDKELQVLENEQKLLSGQMRSYMNQINEMAKEFGSKELGGRYDMKLQRVAKLMATLTEVEARRIYLQAQVKLLEQTDQETVSPQEWVTMKEEYVNKDPAVVARTTNIIAMEQALIIARQELAEGNPQIKQKEELLAALKQGLEEQKENVRKTFDDLMEGEKSSLSSKRLAALKLERDQTKAHEDELRDMLAAEDAQTINLGQKELAIQDLQDQLTFTKDLYDTVSKRIQEFKMERKRPARISPGVPAEVTEVLDKRTKYTAALVFGSLACGMLLAFLKDKKDLSLRTQDDVARRIGLRVIGTTTGMHGVRAALPPEHVAGEYQTIRTNLGLLEGNGMPKILVVTSPGMQEGKTTFAVNLAISTSKSGRKVLLIDGDLRNPHIASLLDLPEGSRGLQDVLSGKGLRQSICSMPSNGLDVLAADAHNIADAFELLASSLSAERLNEISHDYDHVIIDTPPVLAFADALIWARIADGVVLTCFAGQTTGPNLMLSNVEWDDSYHPYGYHYYGRGGRSKADGKRDRSKMLLPMEAPNSEAESS